MSYPNFHLIVTSDCMVSFQDVQTAYYMVAATGVLVAAIYYVLNMRATQRNSKAALETRQAQLYMQILNQFDTLEYQKTWQEVIGWEFKTPEEFMDRIWSIKDNRAKMAYVAFLFEGVGVAVNKKLISIDLIDDLFSIWVISYWEKFGAIELYFREKFNAPQDAEWIEYLYNEVVKVSVKQHPNLQGDTKSMMESFNSRT